MLTVEQNDRLTRVGPGSPTGELMRRYWHPISAVAMMNDRATKPIRLLGEDLILYKSNKGVYGLVDNYCPHRRMGMVYGIPTDEGIRCAYHGWMFDETGRCLEQPYEETEAPDNRFKDKVRIKAYPLEVKAGLIFAYIGPSPAPLLPELGRLLPGRRRSRHRLHGAPLQLAPVPGELAGPRALRVAAR